MQKVFLFTLLALICWSCQSEDVQESSANVTDSGFEYTIHTSNADGALPEVGDMVYYHVQKRIRDTVLSSSRAYGKEQRQVIRPSDPVGQPTPILDLIKLMHAGDSATVSIYIDTIPNKPIMYQDVAYIHYDVVLNNIKTKEDVQAEMQAGKVRADSIGLMLKETLDKYNSGALGSQLKKTESGLKYVIHKEGDGKLAAPNRRVIADYYGVLANGTRFDDSYSRGEPIEFIVGRRNVIQGWDEGFALLKEGSLATFFIPSELGYGPQGSPPVIPGGAELVFQVELLEVN